MNSFTAARAKNLLSTWKQRHGRDINRSELLGEGFTEDMIEELVKHNVITKYQVTAKGGRVENRYKLTSDWRQINKL
jgi:hypothetical protein